MTQSTLRRSLVERIRTRLHDLDMSQSELARQMDMGIDALSRRLREKIPFKAEEISEIAKILDIPVESLMSEDDCDCGMPERDHGLQCLDAELPE